MRGALTAILLSLSFPVAFSTSNLAIARTFSINDAPQLVESFDVWDVYPPCNNDTESSFFDLFLVFSQTLETSTVAQNAVNQVKQRFQESNGWGQCIDQIVSFGVKIEPELDIYRSEEQDTNPLWVNGPNRQFERTVRALQGTEYGAYDIMYLMEMDSVPMKPFWLNVIVSEIESQEQDFAILGSKYRGDKWDPFYSQLPLSLINHINGNAIYNLRNPVFDLIVAQLESEASTVANSVPYDYRISQIVEEVESSVRASFLNYSGVPLLHQLPSNFVRLAGAFGIQDTIRETPILGNYASTNMIESFFDEREFVIHGAKLRQRWDDKKLGALSLVVSDWSDANSQVLLSNIDKSQHPFTTVVVLLPDGTQPPKSAVTSTIVNFTPRGNSSDKMDLCSAPVDTDWFMMTDSYHQLRQDVEPMIQYDGGMYKPVIPFSKASPEACFVYPSCVQDLQMAKKILPSADDIYQHQAIVYHSASRDKYCRIWEKYSANGISPSATSYIAFLQKHGLASEIYVFSDTGSFGDRLAFLPLATSTLSPTMIRQRRLIGNITAGNSSCTSYRTIDECNVESECEWRQQFTSCREHSKALSNVNRGEQEKDRLPHWAQILIWLGIAGGVIALIILLVVGAGRLTSSSDSSVSLVPVISTEEQEYQLDTEGAGGESGADLATSSFETVDLNGAALVEDGHFEVNDGGIEFVSKKIDL